MAGVPKSDADMPTHILRGEGVRGVRGVRGWEGMRGDEEGRGERVSGEGKWEEG